MSKQEFQKTDAPQGDQKPRLTPKENLVQVLKFVVFSLGAGIIQLLSFTLLNEVAKLTYWVSYLISLALSVLYNFTVNRRFTFKSANNVPLAMFLVFLFYCAFTPYSTFLTDLLTKKEWNEYLVVVINMVQNLVLEFLWCRFVVYRKSINTNKSAKQKAGQPDALPPPYRGTANEPPNEQDEIDGNIYK